MDAQHNEALRKQKTIDSSKKAKRSEKKKKSQADSYFDQNPGAGPLLGCTTIYMDSYKRAKCSSAKLQRRYNNMSYMQQY